MVNLRVAIQEIERPAANKEGNPGIWEATAERVNHRRREDSVADEAETEYQNPLNPSINHKIMLPTKNFRMCTTSQKYVGITFSTKQKPVILCDTSFKHIAKSKYFTLDFPGPE